MGTSEDHGIIYYSVVLGEQATFQLCFYFRSKWERDPLQYASKAYTTARQELSILIHLKHPHIVPLVGICSNPLSIVLELAPAGALDARLRHYKRSGAQLGPKTVQLVVLQVARAMEYLHQHHIIYRY